MKAIPAILLIKRNMAGYFITTLFQRGNFSPTPYTVATCLMNMFIIGVHNFIAFRTPVSQATVTICHSAYKSLDSAFTVAICTFLTSCHNFFVRYPFNFYQWYSYPCIICPFFL